MSIAFRAAVLQNKSRKGSRLKKRLVKARVKNKCMLISEGVSPSGKFSDEEGPAHEKEDGV